MATVPANATSWVVVRTPEDRQLPMTTMTATAAAISALNWCVRISAAPARPDATIRDTPRPASFLRVTSPRRASQNHGRHASAMASGKSPRKNRLVINGYGDATIIPTPLRPATVVVHGSCREPGATSDRASMKVPSAPKSTVTTIVTRTATSTVVPVISPTITTARYASGE